MGAKRVVYAALILAGSVAGAHAAPIYNSIGAGTLTAISSGVFADSFHTDASGKLSEVEIALARTSLNSTGGTIISLWGDNGSGIGAPASDAPGARIATIAAVTDSQISAVNTKTLFDFTGLGLTLSPNTEYWIELSRNGSTTSTQRYYKNSVAPTIGSTFAGNSELFFQTTVASTTPPEMELCANSGVGGGGTCTSLNGGSPVIVSAAPEPGTLGIIGTALVGFGLVVCRRRRSDVSA